MPADFVSTVNADLRVGALEETVTVTGESPIVDVQSARRRRTLDNNLIEALPTAQGYAGVMVLMPSMIVSGGGNTNVQLSTGMIVFGGRGGRGNEGIAQTDGIGTGRRHQRRRRLGLRAARHDGGSRHDLHRRPRGSRGRRARSINLIPRTGSNTFQNRYSGVRPDRRDAGQQLHAGAERRRPAHARRKRTIIGISSLIERRAIMKDRLWFFYATRYSGSGNDVPGIFYNKNAGDPTKWTYEPDLSRPARNSSSGAIDADPAPDGAGHAPQQVEPSFDADAAGSATIRRSASRRLRPRQRPRPARSGGNGRSACSSSGGPRPLTSRLLLEAGYGTVPPELERARECRATTVT